MTRILFVSPRPLVQKMSSRQDLLSVSFGGLVKVLDDNESHLHKHDEQIQELYNLLRNFATKDDLNQLRNELKDMLDKELAAIRADLKDQMEEFKKNMNDKFQDMRNELDKAIEGAKNNKDERYESLSKRLEKCEAKADENRGFIQTVANAYAGVSRNTASLDDSLARTMGESTERVNRDFTNIFEQLKNLKQRVKELKTAPPPPPQVVEREVVREAEPQIDLSGLNLRPDCTMEFEEPPTLPKLEKFDKVESSVDYMYEMVPKLQAILNCYHDKIGSLPNTDLDRSFLTDLIDKIKNAMAGMAKELEDLKNSMNKGLTRADVAKMIREMMQAEEENDQTAIGCVKCIACGRDMRQVSGAMTEDEAFKTLGAAPNSVAMFPDIGSGPIGQMYSKTLDRDSLESPRATRPFRKCKVMKHYRPHPPHTP